MGHKLKILVLDDLKNQGSTLLIARLPRVRQECQKRMVPSLQFCFLVVRNFRGQPLKTLWLIWGFPKEGKYYWQTASLGVPPFMETSICWLMIIFAYKTTIFGRSCDG